MSNEKPFFSTNFCLFYTQYKKYQFCVKRLCEHIKCQVIRSKLFIHFLCLNLFKIYLEKQEHMLPGAKTSPPTSSSINWYNIYSINNTLSISGEPLFPLCDKQRIEGPPVPPSSTKGLTIDQLLPQSQAN